MNGDAAGLEGAGLEVANLTVRVGSATGTGRLSFTMSWKIQALVTALGNHRSTGSGESASAASSSTKLLNGSLKSVMQACGAS